MWRFDTAKLNCNTRHNSLPHLYVIENVSRQETNNSALWKIWGCQFSPPLLPLSIYIRSLVVCNLRSWFLSNDFCVFYPPSLGLGFNKHIRLQDYQHLKFKLKHKLTIFISGGILSLRKYTCTTGCEKLKYMHSGEKYLRFKTLSALVAPRLVQSCSDMGSENMHIPAICCVNEGLIHVIVVICHPL
jgi:hypothetical protein